MALIYTTLVFVVAAVLKGDCQLFNFLSGVNNPAQFARNLLNSFASQVPQSSQNSAGTSRFPDPQPPEVLQKALNLAPPPGAAQAPNAMENLISMFGATRGHGSSAAAHGGPSAGSSVPVTANMKAMVNKWANQLGHRAYYEAHGCVDPITSLHGRHGRLAGIALMMGCNNYHAGEVCEMAQMAHAGGQGAGMRSMMDSMMGADMKHMLEECLTPSTLMKGMFSMAHQNSQPGFSPPAGAASKSASKVDCSGISQMLMMSTAAEGIMNMEGMEQIGVMRNRYFKMTCQENMILGSLPYRLCCPGYVRPPTMEEAMMVRSMTGV